jgi:hypothetical protein
MTDPVANRRWMQDRPTREQADPTGALGGRVTIWPQLHQMFSDTRPMTSPKRP